MRIAYNVKRRCAFRLKFGDKFLIRLIKLVLEECIKTINFTKII